MNVMEMISTLSGVIFIIGFLPYIRAILRGETKPSKASWIIWASLDSVTLAGMVAKGTLNGQIVGAVLGAWIVVVLALMKGTPGWTKLDKMCLFGAILGIALWMIFSNPVLGIMTSLSVVLIGSFPTFVSASRDPSHENRTAWTLFWISCLLAVIAIPSWTLADAAQPLVFTIVESVMMYLLYIKPLIAKPKAIAVSNTLVTSTKSERKSVVEEVDV